MNINCCHLSAVQKYFCEDVQRSPLLLAVFIFSLLIVSFLFQGCATTKIVEIQGTITTPQNRPFYVVSDDHKISIKPGNMEIVLIEQNRKFSLDSSTWFLQIDTDQGVLVAKFPEGELPDNKLFTVGAKQGLSTDIAVSWIDITEEIYDVQTIQSCTYDEWCWQTYTETVCDGHGKCWTESKTELTTCSYPGTQKVKITNEKYKRFYTAEFLNPQNNTDCYGRFAGQLENLQRELARKPLSACR